MSTERTFSIIKPDAVERNKIGEITAMLENAGLRVVASKRLKLDQAKASQFYEVHKERPFFQSLCDFMCSGPIVVQVLEGEDAVKRNREIMGATNPEEAAAGTIRKKYALSLEARLLAREASEAAMSFAPTVFKNKKGEKVVTNGPALFFKTDQAIGSELVPANERWSREKAKNEKFIYQNPSHPEETLVIIKTKA